MPIQLDDLWIEDNQLTYVVFNYDHDIYFRGRALDDEGEKIHKRLARFNTGQLVEVRAEYDNNFREGVYEIYEIEIPPREEPTKDRVVFRFSGKLRPKY